MLAPEDCVSEEKSHFNFYRNNHIRNIDVHLKSYDWTDENNICEASTYITISDQDFAMKSFIALNAVIEDYKALGWIVGFASPEGELKFTGQMVYKFVFSKPLPELNREEIKGPITV